MECETSPSADLDPDPEPWSPSPCKTPSSLPELQATNRALRKRSREQARKLRQVLAAVAHKLEERDREVQKVSGDNACLIRAGKGWAQYH
jgi:hypothetical protein